MIILVVEECWNGKANIYTPIWAWIREEVRWMGQGSFVYDIMMETSCILIIWLPNNLLRQLQQVMPLSSHTWSNDDDDQWSTRLKLIHHICKELGVCHVKKDSNTSSVCVGRVWDMDNHGFCEVPLTKYQRTVSINYQNPLFIIRITTMRKLTSQAKEAKASQKSPQVPLLL